MPAPSGYSKQYAKLTIETEVENATPHRLIQMLLDGALTRLARAQGSMGRGDIAAKGENIGRVIAIMETLSASLNKDAGEVADNLESLYDYVTRILLQANINNDPAHLEEAASLLRTIKSAWDGIAPEGDSAPGKPTDDRLRGRV